MTTQEQTTIKLYWQAVNMHECIIASNYSHARKLPALRACLRRRERRFEAMMAEAQETRNAQ